MFSDRFIRCFEAVFRAREVLFTIGVKTCFTKLDKRMRKNSVYRLTTGIHTVLVKSVQKSVLLLSDFILLQRFYAVIDWHLSS